MAKVGRYSRRRAGRSDSGATWISYSDMMAALLLVFVLVLCYSIYQYFVMLETKTTELSEKEGLLTLQQATLDEQEAKLVLQQSTLRDQQDKLIEQQNALLIKQNELDGALTSIEEQRGLLDAQNLTLEEQRAAIAAANAALISKEDALNMAQEELADKESEMIALKIQLDEQKREIDSKQGELDKQQGKLEDLVGLRTVIIKKLSIALSEKNLTAKVDQKTGDIALSSNVFFDTGKANILPEGLAQLDRFIPVYLSVLLDGDTAQNLGEIIIEGHTDSDGTYASNLQLSQERALSVAEYCLNMRNLSQEQRNMLQKVLTIKGRSSSDLVYDEYGAEDKDASRRVEFKFSLRDDEMINELRQILSGEGQ